MPNHPTQTRPDFGLTRSDNPNWDAARLVLDAPTLRNRVVPYLDDLSQEIRPSILREPWSSGERCLIDLALSLTSSQHKLSLYSALDGLDEDNGRRVLGALAIVIGIGIGTDERWSPVTPTEEVVDDAREVRAVAARELPTL